MVHKAKTPVSISSGSAEIEVRNLRLKDLERIVDIDKKILGIARPDYWDMRMRRIVDTSPISPLVAISQEKVIGFIIGYTSGWEYGAPEHTGWIEDIGVDPDYQRKGVASTLLKEMVNLLKKVGVIKVYTMVNWRSSDMLQFFDHMGFTHGDMINLELQIT
jgi:ribosomal protein S18 acetylase RimI-like enzyme